MKSFKTIAEKILRDSDKPMHYRDIAKVALSKGLIKTEGKTPWATMNAVVSVDIIKNKDNSPFIKVGSGKYKYNTKYVPKMVRSKVKGKRKMSEEFVKNCIVIYLTNNGWKITKLLGLKKKGLDIKAQKGNRYFFIEAKGQSERPQASEVAFVYSLGQIVTRMKVVDAKHAYNYGLALPYESAQIAQRRIPWKLAEKLSLYVFSVKQDGSVRKLSWKDMGKTNQQIDELIQQDKGRSLEKAH